MSEHSQAVIDAQQREAEITRRFAADEVAQAVAITTLPTYGGYTVRQALGISGCLKIADDLRKSWGMTKR